MWFEILPSAAIIVGALALPGYALYGVRLLTLDNPFRRDMEERFDRVMYQRDVRITGSAYKMNGLDAVPDKD